MAARKSKERAEQELASQWIDLFIHAANAKRTREQVWRDARRRYEPGFVDKQRVKRPPYVKVDYLFNTINHKVAQLMSATEANGVTVQARGTTKDNLDVGETVTHALERQFRWRSSYFKDDNDEVLERAARNGLLYGNSWVHCMWYEDATDWGVRLDLLDPMDVFPDWRHGRWYIVRRWVTMAELNDMVEGCWSAPLIESRRDPLTGETTEVDLGPRDGGRARKAFRKLLKEVRAGKRTEYSITDYADRALKRQIDLKRVSGDEYFDEHSNLDDPYNARVEVLQVFETPRDGRQITMVPYMNPAGGAFVFQNDLNPYGVCTIAEFQCLPVDNEQFAHGYGEILGNTAEVMDYMYRSQIRLVAKKADAPLIHRRSANIRRDFLASPTGKAVEVDEIGSAMAYLEPSSDQGLYGFAMNFAKQVADTGTGMSEQKRGSATGADSATEAAIAEQAGATLDRLMFRRWRKFLEKSGQIMLAILKEHITETKAIAYLGRDSSALVELKPEYLRGNFEVTFGGSELGANQKQEYQTVAHYAQIFGPSGAVDMNGIARVAAKKAGFPDPDEVLVVKKGVPPQTPDHENKQVFQFGQDIVVNMADDDNRHLAEHAAVLQAVSQMEPTHPGIAKMAMHMRVHEAQRQQKLMAQMAGVAPGGGGGPAGPQPFDATQAGGAGQPRSANPALDGLNEQRNQSNVAAAGAAPGPIAPNRPVGSTMPPSGPTR